MKRLFILFLVVVMLAGCGRRSILNHDIEGQDVYIQQKTREKTEEEPARKGQIGKIIDGINRHNIIYGTGMIVVGVAALKKFENPRIEYASIFMLLLGVITVADRLSL